MKSEAAPMKSLLITLHVHVTLQLPDAANGLEVSLPAPNHGLSLIHIATEDICEL